MLMMMKQDLPSKCKWEYTSPVAIEIPSLFGQTILTIIHPFYSLGTNVAPRERETCQRAKGLVGDWLQGSVLISEIFFFSRVRLYSYFLHFTRLSQHPKKGNQVR